MKPSEDILATNEKKPPIIETTMHVTSAALFRRHPPYAQRIHQHTVTKIRPINGRRRLAVWSLPKNDVLPPEPAGYDYA